MRPQLFFNRHDIARIIDLPSYEAVRYNEARLGLDVARCDVNARLVRYHAPVAIQQLSLRGHIAPDLREILVAGLMQARSSLSREYGPKRGALRIAPLGNCIQGTL